MKKYELTAECKEFLGRKLYRIKALVAFGNVKEGEIGGWIEKKENLSQSGNAWVSGNARVYGDAEVYGNAMVSGNARVYGDAEVSGDAWVYGNARVSGNAMVSGNAWVYGNAEVYGNARVYGDAEVSGNAWVSGNARVSGNAWVYGDAEIKKKTHLLEIGFIGSRDDVTTFFRTKNKEIFVKCGCFSGNIDDFEKQVREVHGEDKHGRVYALAIAMAKEQIELDNEDVEEENE